VQALVTQHQIARLPEAPDLGLDFPRLVAPVVGAGALLGFISVIAADRPLDAGDRRRIRRAALVAGLELARRQAAFSAEVRAAGGALEALLDPARTLDLSEAERA